MWAVEDVARALRESWSAETCDPVDVPFWTSDNPAKGQCGVTALVLNDVFGGHLVLADVLWPDGSRQGSHYWNQLPDGSEVDLTIDQFTLGEVVQEGRVVVRPSGPPRRCAEQYALLRERVIALMPGHLSRLVGP